ncbi:GPN-loop GTPase 3-like protein [Dinothrombium tinctorium]|uniref:GPN-loop GTPase 3 n=1 Tax=Dinothrombium tinctorium TaxID=1965070 RepID=A0A3S3NTT9_9ACAR|nr:GPN-loop GTPase 3-like protein [Dinothrombium tinctorium]RWS09015.1 GPN-loop GTPase 3-like protein [Dinothrombium tinctorium]
MRYAHLVLGPAGSGKSSYCSALAKHCEATRRKLDVVNLDPAAETFDYEPVVDIRDLISLSDVMEDEELRFGPNGGLMFCMQYLSNNLEWLSEQLGEVDEDYVLFDFPGQIEIYTDSNFVSKFINHLQTLNFRVCGVFLIDSQFITDVAKFISGVFVALSTMIHFEIPFINILSKTDLLNPIDRRKIGKFLEPMADILEEDSLLNTKWGEKYKKLTKTIASLVEEYSLVKFTALNILNENSLNDVLLLVDSAIQYGEESEVRTVDDFNQERNGVCE